MRAARHAGACVARRLALGHRHPIYTGIMLAMLGSALAAGIVWLALFALSFLYPDAYPAYRRRTRMLIPFVF